MNEEYQAESTNCSFCKEVAWKGSNSNRKQFIQDLFHSNCITCSIPNSGEDISLCPFCRHLRVQHLIVCRRLDFKQTVKVTVSLPDIFERSSKCCLCRVFVHTASTYSDLASLDSDCLRLGSLDLELWSGIFSYIFNGMNWRYTASIAIDSQPTEREGHGIHSVRTKDITDPCASPIVGGYVDWKTIRTWCDSIDTGLSREHVQRPQRMKVIDVHKNRVITLPTDSEYAALSYVYGKTKKLELPSLPYFERKNLPLTIQDALHACDKMGMQYLWVDQLCINQSDENERSNQINQMDRIYAWALYTLVALAGKDSNYGLPGVTRPRSWAHGIVKIGDVSLKNRAPSLATCIDYSTWFTRGWTLQEAMLSPRLLYFTEYGIYYVYPGPGVRFESKAPCELATGYNLPTLDKHWTVVEQYTTRNLTFPSDALCAISAVLRTMHGDEGIYYGLPVSHMDQAVVWLPTDKGPNAKRDGFPSWSWVSHEGSITHSIVVLAGLATWMTPKHGLRRGLNICKPGPYIRKFFFGRYNAINIAMSWLKGCISSDFPLDPKLSTSTIDTLTARWPTYDAFWEDAFGGFANDNIELMEHCELAPGHILVYGQIAQFSLDGSKYGENRDMFIVRSRKGVPSGALWIPAYNQRAHMNTTREFIALSLADGAIFDGTTALAFEKRCKEHPGLDYGELNFPYGTEEILPVLNVMIIERNLDSNVARRLGVGTIFLKEWADADREFRTVVLE